MKDKLLYATIGLLVGIVVTQAGIINRSELAVPVATAGVVVDGPGIVAWSKSDNVNFSAAALDEFGQAWYVGWNGGGGDWQPAIHSPLPVPVSEIKFWSLQVFITNDDVVWSLDDGTPGWVNRGPWPSDPVPTNENSWGKIKSQYTD